MHSVGREDKMEQQNLQDNTDIEIDVLELFHVLLNKFWIILLAGIIAGLAFIGGTILFITPQYESTTKMYVLSKQDNNTLTQQDMQTSLSLTKDYAELIKSRTVTEGVIAQLNLDLTHEELLKNAMYYIEVFIRRVSPKEELHMIGPAAASVGKVKDVYRQVIHLKHRDICFLTAVREKLEKYIEINSGFRKIYIQFDMN